MSARTTKFGCVPCDECPLRALEIFRPFTDKELAFMLEFKRGELRVESGATVLVEGAHSAHLYTVLSGWGFRYKTLEDGRRQILNYVLPGDLIGLQGPVLGEMQHSVEALQPIVLCVFERDRLNRLFQNHPSLAYDVTWLAAREESMLDDHLLSVGRRTAAERAAYLLSFLHQRMDALGLGGNPTRIPVTQTHIADTLGLSSVHTNRTLRKLAARGYIRWELGGCTIVKPEALLVLSGWDGIVEAARPLI
ncbi:MAG: Crp/Fnr family transcriptional regulator [Flavobacteriaceae bacterium]